MPSAKSYLKTVIIILLSVLICCIIILSLVPPVSKDALMKFQALYSLTIR